MNDFIIFCGLISPNKEKKRSLFRIVSE